MYWKNQMKLYGKLLAIFLIKTWFCPPETYSLVGKLWQAHILVIGNIPTEA